MSSDWAFAVLIGVIVISISSCTAIGIVSNDKAKIELEKLKYEQTQ